MGSTHADGLGSGGEHHETVWELEPVSVWGCREGGGGGGGETGKMEGGI